MIAGYRKLTRRKVRYWCFRYKTEAGSRTELPGASAKGSPRGLRKHFETHRHFLGWEQFNESMGWDVDEVDQFMIVPLRKGSADAWAETVEEEATDFPMPALDDVPKDGVEDGT